MGEAGQPAFEIAGTYRALPGDTQMVASSYHALRMSATNTGVQRAAQEMDRPQPERAGKRAKRGHWT